MQWLVNTSLLKFICRDVWLCNLTYPVIYRLILTKSDLCETSNILSITYKQLHLISALKTTINEMIWSPSSALALHRSVQLKLNSDVKWAIKLIQKQIRTNAKQNGIRWYQQCDKPGAVGRIECNMLIGYELRTNYVKNTTSVSSCYMEQVTPTKYPNQIYV